MRAQSKDGNHFDKHGRGIKWYKLRSVQLPEKCHLSLRAALSDLELPPPSDRQAALNTPGLTPSMENKATPKSGIL